MFICFLFCVVHVFSIVCMFSTFLNACLRALYDCYVLLLYVFRSWFICVLFVVFLDCVSVLIHLYDVCIRFSMFCMCVCVF